MSLLMKLPELMQECRSEFEKYEEEEVKTQYRPIEQIGSGDNDFVCGDNLQYMRYLLHVKEKKESLQLIYVDPPFFSQADYQNCIEIFDDNQDKTLRLKQKSYKDTWENGMEEYLKMLTIRFFYMKELLSSTGCLWVHLDWHAVHYVKIILDEIFGQDHLENEVIWHYKSGGVSKKRFARKHDILLFYSKTKQYYFQPQKEKSYNRGMKPYHFKGVQEYQDEIGWYTLVNMKDVWSIDMVGRTSGERTGYATQKPEALLERVLTSCTKEGDLCADFFCGSGTLPAVANRMKRRFIGCDRGDLALANGVKRLTKSKANFTIWRENKPLEKSADDLVANRGKLQYILEENCVSLIAYEPTERAWQEAGELLSDKIKQQSLIDPLALVDYWSLDFHYNGKIFKPEQHFFREKGKLKTTYQYTFDDDGCSSIAIRIVDILGNYMIYRCQ